MRRRRCRSKRAIIPEELKNRIWNVLYPVFFRHVSADYPDDQYDENFGVLSIDLRHNFFRIPVDERGYPDHERDMLRGRYFATEFPKFYDLLEHLANARYANIEKGWTRRCNRVFEEERAQFRFVGKMIAPITAEHEIEEIEKASTGGSGEEHIRRALALYAKRPTPDYRNSIKESISAVERVYRTFTGEKHGSIGAAIKDMEKKGIVLEPILKEGFSKIYGWTSGKGGIRHALMEESSNAGEAEARLMLVMCSAYANYLKSLQARRPRQA